VASCDWIKKDYIIKEVRYPLILDAGNIVYPYQSTNMFRDEFLYSDPIQRQALIITDVGPFALAVSIPLLQPFGAIAVS
jgi:hypothetical protein